MNVAIKYLVKAGTHKPLVAGSNPAAATSSKVVIAASSNTKSPLRC